MRPGRLSRREAVIETRVRDEVQYQTAAAPGPPAAAQGRTGDANGSRKWWVLVAMVFGLFMPMLDNLVVNVALPTIQRTLGAQISDLQWIIDAYTLTFASFMLTGGSLGDLYGRKKFFMGGLLIFTAGSLACGLSSSTDQLVMFRAMQGLGAALLLPGSLSIITATFHGRERGAAIGIWAAMSGLAIAAGPVVGGYMVEHHSWESIFYINIPVGIVGFLLTAIVVRDSRDPSRSRRVDPPGLITGTAGLFALVYALIEGNDLGWRNNRILGSFAVAAVMLIIFLVIESKKKFPMLPLHFFRNPTFAASNVVAASVFFAMFGTTFFLALYLQNIRGYSPFEAGLRLVPFTAAILVLAPLSGRLSDRHGSRWLMTAGTALAACGMALLLRTEVHSSYMGVILPAFLVLGSGMAITMAPMTAAVMGSVDPRHAGVASAATNTSRELGGVFGIALLGAVVTSTFERRFLSTLVSDGVPGRIARTIVKNASANAAAGGGSTEAFRRQAPPGIPSQLIQTISRAAEQSFVHSIHVGMRVAIGFMLLASVVAATFVRSHIKKEEPAGGPQGDHLGDAPPIPAARPAVAAAMDEPRATASQGPPGFYPSGGDGAGRAKHALEILPYQAGAGTVQANLESVFHPILELYRRAVSEGRQLTWLTEPNGHAGTPPTSLSIWPVAGYLVVEQRFGRVSREASPQQAATLLMGAIAARALGLQADSHRDGASQDDRDFVQNAIRIVLDGIGNSPANGAASPAGRRARSSSASATMGAGSSEPAGTAQAAAGGQHPPGDGQ